MSNSSSAKPAAAQYRHLPVVLFCNVPNGAAIIFNGCHAIKLDSEHVRFTHDCDGNPLDYNQGYNARYARATQHAIGGTPVRIVAQPKPEAEDNFLDVATGTIAAVLTSPGFIEKKPYDLALAIRTALKATGWKIVRAPVKRLTKAEGRELEALTSIDVFERTPEQAARTQELLKKFNREVHAQD